MSSLVDTFFDFKAGKVPKRAKDMASMTELFPAPMTPMRTLTPRWKRMVVCLCVFQFMSSTDSIIRKPH